MKRNRRKYYCKKHLHTWHGFDLYFYRANWEYHLLETNYLKLEEAKVYNEINKGPLAQ